MGRIEVILNSETFYMTEENATDSLEKISKALAPEVPVLVERFDRDFGHSKTSVYGEMFFSNGTLTKEGKFEISSNDSKFFLNFFGKPEHYKLIPIKKEVSDSINLPHLGNREMIPGQPARIYGSGTRKLIIGDAFGRDYPEQLEALMFAKSAIQVNIPPIYSRPGAVLGLAMAETDVDKVNFVNEIASMNALANIIMYYIAPSNSNNWPLIATKVSNLFYHGTTLAEFKKKVHVDDSDYVLTRLNINANNAIVAVKLYNGYRYGDMFVNPIECTEKIKKALSPNVVSMHYPEQGEMIKVLSGVVTLVKNI